MTLILQGEHKPYPIDPETFPSFSENTQKALTPLYLKVSGLKSMPNDGRTPLDPKRVLTLYQNSLNRSRQIDAHPRLEGASALARTAMNVAILGAFVFTLSLSWTSLTLAVSYFALGKFNAYIAGQEGTFFFPTYPIAEYRRIEIILSRCSHIAHATCNGISLLFKEKSAEIAELVHSHESDQVKNELTKASLFFSEIREQNVPSR